MSSNDSNSTLDCPPKNGWAGGIQVAFNRSFHPISPPLDGTTGKNE